MQGMNFRRMVFTMRQAQKAFFEHGGNDLLKTARAWEAKVDKWLEDNAQDEIKLQLFSSGRPMPEMPGIYNVRHESTTEEKTGE